MVRREVLFYTWAACPARILSLLCGLRYGENIHMDVIIVGQNSGPSFVPEIDSNGR